MMGGDNMLRNIKNRMEFQNDRNLYVAVPFPEIISTDSWSNLEDVPKREKSTKLYFETLIGKELFLSFVRKEGEMYAKLYIVQNTQVHILYVRSSTLNPTDQYRGNLVQVK